MSSEEQRYNQLLQFMTTFKTSMENNMTVTNEKLDRKMNEITEEVREVKTTISDNEKITEQRMKRMDERLDKLEDEMTKAADEKKKRREILLRQHEKQKEAGKEQGEKDPLENTEKYQRNLKTFNRRKITPEDLVGGESQKEKQPSYKSTWAKDIENELGRAAEMTVIDKPDEMKTTAAAAAAAPRMEELRNSEDWWEDRHGKARHENWEVLLPKKKPKTVKPPRETKSWFGEDKTESSNSDSTDTLEEKLGPWTEVQRVRMRKMRNSERIEKRKTKMSEVATKMKHMLGIGPILDSTIRHFQEQTKDYNEALKKSVQEYMVYYLAFEEDELENFQILDLKRSASGNVIYFAMQNENHVKEFYYRKAASQNQDLIIRDYIPPQYHARYMALSAQAAVARSENKNIKTQIRWGDHDVEMFVKSKGNDEQYRKIKLKDFMGSTKLPDFDMAIRWKKFDEQKPRKKLIFGEGRPLLPSLRNTGLTKTGLSRQLSNASSVTNHKKSRFEDDKSEDGDVSGIETEHMDESTNSQKELAGKQ